MIEATSENAFRAGTSNPQRPASGKPTYSQLTARILSEWPTIRSEPRDSISAHTSRFRSMCSLVMRADFQANHQSR